MEEVNERNYSYYSPVKNDVTYRDPYLEEMRMKLRQMRSERKEAERETKQMHIKLTTLKNENKANWSEIEKTKMKTNKKMNLLEQFVKAKEQKQKLKEEKEYRIQMQKEQNRLLRESINDSRKKQEYLNEKYEKALLQKLQREYNKELGIYLKNLERAKNRQKADAVRGQVSTYRENKEKRMLTQRKEMQKQLEDQLIEEYKKIEMLEKKKMEIENEGNKVIKELEESNRIKNNFANRLQMLSLDQLYYNNNTRSNFDNSTYSNTEMRYNNE